MILLQGLDIPIIWTDTIDHFILKSILPIVSILKKKNKNPTQQSLVVWGCGFL